MKSMTEDYFIKLIKFKKCKLIDEIITTFCILFYLVIWNNRTFTTDKQINLDIFIQIVLFFGVFPITLRMERIIYII